MRGMTSLHLSSAHSAAAHLGEQMDDLLDEKSTHPLLRTLGLASLVLGATALGLYLGRELRQRYKFNRRTPYDYYSNAGDPVAITEYGMGI